MKRKLLTLTAALLCAVAMWAQSWTGNAPAAGDFYLYNVGREQFLTSGNWWGTHAALDTDGMKLTFARISDGVYTLSTATGFAGKYLGDNEFMDNETAANWTFERVGDTDKYTMKTGDNYFVVNGNGVPLNTTTAPTSNDGYWQLVTKTQLEANLLNATPANPIDASFYMTNPKVRRGWPKSISGTELSDNGSFIASAEGLYAGGCSSYGQYHKTFDNYQSLTGVKKGKYKVKAKGVIRDDGYSAIPYLYANNVKGANLKTIVDSDYSSYTQETDAKDKVTHLFVDDTYLLDELEVVVTDGNLRVGVKSDADAGWATFTQFSLLFSDPCISEVAVDFPSGSVMAAGQWYKFTVSDAGDYGFSQTSNIILSNDGNQLLSEATGDALTSTMALSVGTYYIKSTTAQTVSKSGPFTYTIGSAASDKEYIQPGNTVTISYASMGTTNTYTEELDSEISGVTFGGNAISVSRTTKGFTFTVPTVTAGTDYILSIPANVIGYQAPGSGKNAAQNITLKTPALFNGTYFFKVENETAAKGKYLSRGLAAGTHVTIDSYGLPIKVETDASNRTTFSTRDTEGLFGHWSSWEISADASVGWGNAIYFTVSLNDGKYRLHSNQRPSNEYFKYNDENVTNAIIALADDGTGSNYGPIIDWSIETPSAHAIAMAALKNTQAATAATAAYASGNYETLNGISTAIALSAELSDNYDQTAIESASDISTVEEKYQDDNSSGTVNTPKNVYSGSVSISTPGLYKFSIQAFYRAAGNTRTQTMHTEGIDFPHVVAFFGDAETQLKSVYDEVGPNAATSHDGNADVEYNGMYYPNGVEGAKVFFQEGLYNNDVYFYVSEAGTYNYGVKYLDYAASNAQWFIYTPQSVSVTGYTIANADADDYTALNSAITDAEGHTLGFDKDEYAPYNNTGIFSILETANAIDQESTNYKYVVNASTTALNSFEWNQNATEVNAIAGGYNLDSYTNYGTYDVPNGWSTGGDPYGYFTRTVGISESLIGNNPGLAGAVNERAILVKYGTTYGESTGYTMPLKANTWYALTFKYGIWDENILITKNLSVTDPNGATINVLPGSVSKNEGNKATCANKLSTAWYDKTVWFKTSATAGDYVLNVTNADGNNQRQMVFSGLMLKRAVADNITIAETDTEAPSIQYVNATLTRTLVGGQWNGFSLPFSLTAEQLAASALNGAMIKQFASADENVITMEDATAIVAGEPYLVKPVSNIVDPSFEGVEVSNPVEASHGDGDYKFKAHLYATDLATDGSVAYVSTADSSIKKLGTGGAIKGMRAIFNIPVPNSGSQVKALFIDFGGADGIMTIENGQLTTDNGTIYNLAGQRMSKAQKGVNIINGKKVLVK